MADLTELETDKALGVLELLYSKFAEKQKFRPNTSRTMHWTDEAGDY